MESGSTTFSSTPVAESRARVSFVQRYYIFVKFHYFFYFAAFGIIYPILSITLRARGLSNAEISLVNAIIPFILFLTNPLFGFIADSSRRYKLTFNVVLGLVIILYAAMFMLPSIKSHNIQAHMSQEGSVGRVLNFCASQEVATSCASRSECGCAYQANCSSVDQTKHLFFTFSMNSNTTHKDVRETSDIGASTCGIEYEVPIDAALKSPRDSSLDIFLHNGRSSDLPSCEITCSIPHFCHGLRYSNQMNYVIIYSLIFVIGTNLVNNAITIGASLGFASLPDPSLFGQQRLFGTIGFGIFAFLASRVYSFFQTDRVYIIMFIIAALICMIGTCFVRIQPNRRKRQLTSKKAQITGEELDDPATLKKSAPSGLSALIPALKKLDVWIFLSLTFIWGTSYAVLDPFLYLYIDEIAPCKSRSIVGVMSLVSAASELSALFFVGQILKKLGTSLCSVLILLAFSIRFGGFYLISNPWFFPVMETMHFFNFGILYVLIAQEADAIAPPGLSGTLQGVAYGVLFGLGRGVGLLVAPLIYNYVNQRSLFLFASLFNLLAAVLFGIYFLIVKMRSSKSPNSESKTETNIKVMSPADAYPNEEPLLVRSS